MADLFAGVQNFVPAFQGRQLAIQAGQGAGQSISRGMQTAQRGKALQLEQEQFKFKQDQYKDSIQRLDMFKKWLDSQIGGM